MNDPRQGEEAPPWAQRLEAKLDTVLENLPLLQAVHGDSETAARVKREAARTAGQAERLRQEMLALHGKRTGTRG